VSPRSKIDLGRVFARLNERYFDGKVGASIEWGRTRPACPAGRKTMSLGSYTNEGRRIRINPVLDNDWVPRRFVDYVVYHEMLHAHLGLRKAYHSGKFRQREREFRYYRFAVDWQSANLARLLRSR
jgi:predicted metal-dependent hydrolase